VKNSARLASLTVAAFGIACGGTSTPTSTDMAHGPITTGCVPTGYSALPFLSTDPVRSFAKADMTLVAGKDYVAAIDTDIGCIALDLYEQQTPVTTNSFVFLALHHFFDGLAFHRVLDGFVAQTGDPNSASGPPSSWGTGGPGYMFGLEVSPDLNFDAAGVVGMARATDPSTNGSQFFITLDAAGSLDQKYTVFARVLSSLDLLPSIVRGEPPDAPTRITQVTIASK